MQTMHAWIVRTNTNAPPTVVDRLALTTDRASAGLVIDARASSVRIGIPWTFDGPLHDESEWSLKIGTRKHDLAAMKALAFTSESGKLDSYRAPLANEPFTNTRVAWLTATPTGFRQ